MEAKQLLGEGKIERALECLQENLKPFLNLNNEEACKYDSSILLLKGQYRFLTNNFLEGTIKIDDYTLHINQIMGRLLNLATEIAKLESNKQILTNIVVNTHENETKNISRLVIEKKLLDYTLEEKDKLLSMIFQLLEISK
jgi:hypothetical protein